MASNSSETESRKRRQPINQLKRDQPSTFATRRYAPSRQALDFNTDSLNTSHIPTPSPTKKTAGHGVDAKPRQALDAPTRRSLAAAFKSTSPTNDENRPPSSLSSSSKKRVRQSVKPRPAQATPRRLPRPVSKAENYTRSGTPSPTRGPVGSIVSPLSSASSPPRGLAEAYQRIDDEENLAQEESIDDMETYQYPLPLSDRSREADLIRLQRIQDSASPISLKASRRASPRTSIEDMALVEEQTGDDMTLHSDTTSVLSSLDSLRDGSAGRVESQYAKDAQRLHGVLQGQMFRKARIGEKVGLTVENLRRRNESNESLVRAFGGSVSSRGSDPSLNVPKDWARKARPSRDWLSRINSKSGRYTGDVPKKKIESPVVAETSRREWEEPIDEWIKAAAETPLPAGEDRSSQPTASSRGSTPTNARKSDSTIDKLQDWEINDDEFTGRFLQVSESPPIQIRNISLDRIREREMESLEKRAVTTNRLDELREKTSEEPLRRRKPSSFSEDLQHRVNGEVNGTPQRRRSSVNSHLNHAINGKSQFQRLDPAPVDEGDPIPDTPVVVYKSSPRETDQEKQSARSSRRPSHERRDSHSLLKNLARASSASPSPATEKTLSRSASKIRKENISQPPGHASNDQKGGRPDSPSDQDTRKEIQMTPVITRSAVDLKTPVVTGAWVDKGEDTPGLSIPSIILKTPLVTGAWVDTPLPTGGRGPPMPTPSDLDEAKELTMNLDDDIRKLATTDLIRKLNPTSPGSKSRDQQPLKDSRPLLHKSALEAIISDAKSNSGNPKPATSSADSDSEEDPTIHLGDSTIQSLEEIMENDTNFSAILAPSTTTTPPGEEEENNNDDDDNDESLHNAKRKTSLSDLKTYTQLTTRLNTILPSLRSTKRSLSSLSRSLSSPSLSTTQKSKSLTAATNQNNECNEAGEFHDFIWPCDRCGCPGRPATWEPGFDLTTVRIPIPRLWRWERGDWRPRLTWLGLVTLVGWAWWLGEEWAWYAFPL